ncbi:ankyrin repeat domain-containing protein [Neptuniibacter sp. 2_MG-2023]|uniref:ankyrin repeat domain-containing protein n=1 Tax=Neptuniibacter sp. 2_MG-2023 TaxID=3062671 RepID=UPI0026E3A0EB|nr:ankyrin repeat domain-containing protein [Neptuniibacter sp. 2_MG-2023]MDO6514407.1 ankyrin repeat domain-containing protein [Neptuniibacter sp. 2_MG-2023]
MATLPSFESFLFNAYQSLGLNSQESATNRDQITRFLERKKLSVDKYTERYSDLIKGLLSLLDCESDENLVDDLICSATEIQIGSNNLENRVWTFDASSEQVLWNSLAIYYVPWLARKSAFWHLDTPFPKDMPGGVLWFLPHVEGNKLILPVANAARWLLDEIGVTSPVSLERDLSNNEEMAEKHVSNFIRDIENWLSGKNLSVESIETYFADAAKSPLKGLLNARDDLNWETVRRRFLIARLAQYSYQKLVTELKIDRYKVSTDLSENKALQLTQLFRNIFEWTIQSYDKTKAFRSHEKADESFLEKLSSHPRAFELQSLDASLGESHIEFISELMTEMFKGCVYGSELRDIEHWNEPSKQRISSDTEQLQSTIETRREDFHSTYALYMNDGLLPDIKQGGSLQSLLYLLRQPEIPWKAKHFILKQIRKLKLSGFDEMYAINEELALYLNDHAQKNRKETILRVDELLARAEAHKLGHIFKALTLQYKAKHLLSLNIIDEDENNEDGAITLFERALVACDERNYGPLKGEISRDLLATKIFNTALHPNDRRLYLNIIFGNIIENHDSKNHGQDLLDQIKNASQAIAFEDIAAMSAEYFWENLYAPYAGLRPIKPGISDAVPLMASIMKMIFDNDWDGLKTWIRQNKDKVFRRLNDVRGQTILILMINARHGLLNGYKEGIRYGVIDAEKVTTFEAQLDKAIEILVNIATKRYVEMNDYKYQTPLMLACDGGLSTVVSSLLAKKNLRIDQQDFNKRTALTAAISSGSDACFTMLLEANANPTICTMEGMNALHTAARLGRFKMVEQLVRSHPQLSGSSDKLGLSPLDYAAGVVNNMGYDKWKTILKSQHGRDIGTEDEYKSIIKLLSELKDLDAA